MDCQSTSRPCVQRCLWFVRRASRLLRPPARRLLARRFKAAKMWFQGVDPKQAGRETQQQQAGVYTSTDTNVHLDGDGRACDPNMWL